MADPDSKRLPLLRSPPFPGIAVTVAAVSLPRSASASQTITALPALLALIGAGRIGGSFWARPDDGAPAATVFRTHTAADVVAWAADGSRDSLWLCPDRHLAVPYGRVVAKQIDPWSVLRPDMCLHAHGDDEWIALARIAGAEIRIRSTGRFGSAGATHVTDEVLADALLGGVAYRDPFADAEAGIEQTIALLAEWRRQIDFNRDIAVACGFAWWKRPEMRHFLWAPRPLRFVRAPDRAVRAATAIRGSVAIWPSRISPRLVGRAAQHGVPLVRIEDGFIRSVGLGSNLFPPQSIAVDRRGIHYDPSGPSDLEHLLETSPFPSALLGRADALRRRILNDGISKYGAGKHDDDWPERQPGRQLILVPGQVEDDLSVRLGGGAIAGNLDLLQRVRVAAPDTEIWFRPHPDVDAGHRKGFVKDADTLQFADQVVRGGDMAALLEAVDEVHVLTSLTGFEALLRDRPVTCHGTPFYAGWGLTRDLAAVPDRRTRRLSLLELVSGVLILYPRYLDPATRLPCPPEVLIDRMAAHYRPRANWLTRLRSLQGRFMRLVVK